MPVTAFHPTVHLPAVDRHNVPAELLIRVTARLGVSDCCFIHSVLEINQYHAVILSLSLAREATYKGPSTSPVPTDQYVGADAQGQRA